jgi:ornithine cyclodeaminase/alanine dehydrogenase
VPERDPADLLVRYLSEPEVARVAPGPEEWIELGERALRALADGGVGLPPKATVRSPAGFANAMPASVEAERLLGLKWVSVFRGNAAEGLPAITGLILLVDPETGLPAALVAAAWLTGARTAGVSGACLRALRPAREGHLAITGAGVQARTHLLVAQALGLRDVAVWAHRAASGEALLRWADEQVPGIAVRLAPTAAAAVDGAAAVVTAVSMGVEGVELDPAAVADDALLLPLDYATSVPAALAEDALLVTDDVGQFERFRADGAFPGYRAPDGPSGAALAGPRPAGRVVCQNLGNGAADLFFADAVVRAAVEADAGILLPLL